MTTPGSLTAPDGLTTGGLLGNRLVLHQPARGYRAAIDPVLLAASVPAKAGDIVLETGVGAGAAGLCLLHRVPGCSVTGSEIDRDMRALAAKNAEANGFAARFSVLEPTAVEGAVPPTGFAHAYSNPPFWEAGSGTQSPEAGKATANHETRATVEEWIADLAGRTRHRGTITVIYPAARLDGLVAALEKVAGDMTILPLWPKRDREAKRLIVQGRVGSKGSSRLLPGLVLHNDDGTYSDDAEAILRHGEASPLAET